MVSKDGGPAFPVALTAVDSTPIVYTGMTLRDYFAAAALTGILACQRKHFSLDHDDEFDKERDRIANLPMLSTISAAVCAYEYADEMLAERNRRNATKSGE